MNKFQDILTASKVFETEVTELVKQAGKNKMSRKQMSKNLDKSKAKYKQLKHDLDRLQADDSKIKEELESTKNSLNSERQSITRMHQALEKMDLADCNEAVFYDDDIAYIMDGKEYHLDLDDEGVKLTPMSKHRKSKKDTQCAQDGCTETGEHEHSESEEDENLTDDDLFTLLNSDLGD